MPVFDSPYGPLPELPALNAYTVMIHRPEAEALPNYTAHIDPSTGSRLQIREVKARIADALTGIATPIDSGGFGLLPGGESSGQIVGVYGENSSNYIIATLALLGNTTPYALISSFSTTFELEHAVRLSKATHLFVDAKFIPKATLVGAKFGITPDKIFILNGRRTKGYRSLDGLIETVRKRQFPPVSVQDVKSNTLAYLVFSSGTSGLPKAVMISHTNILASFMQIGIARQAADQVFTPPRPNNPEGIPILLAFLPMYHTYGLHIYVYRSFLSPMTLVIVPKWNVDLALKYIPKFQVTALTLVPSIAHQLANDSRVTAGNVDLTSVSTLATGAAYLPPTLANQLLGLNLAKGAAIASGYGMSECTISAIGTNVPGILGGRPFVPHSDGLLIAGMQAKIMKPDGTEAQRGEVGELWLRGQNIALGYWNNPKSTAETFLPDGWLKTGDSFSIDDTDNFFFADRGKDTLKVGGSQVSPFEIEDVLLAQPDKLITDVSVAGVSGGRTSDEKVPRAWIVLSPAGKKVGEKQVIQTLQTWHQENLSKYKWLRGGIQVVNEIPKLPTGKVLRRVLVERYEKSLKKQTKAKL
ncbi:hypothetical protein DL96DRAFT_1708713 [Flagelloscypha sp. PMI_526]|nr:hypothetical protein DL96DRAFT_1708713 [Flagelloscypha sp. PMI_526]